LAVAEARQNWNKIIVDIHGFAELYRDFAATKQE
jgi:hypothetical protein